MITPTSRVSSSSPLSRPSRVATSASAMIAPWPSRSPSDLRRSASRESRLWTRFASRAGRWVLRVAMPCSPGVRVTWRERRAIRCRRAAPSGSSSPTAATTAPRQALTPAPSISGRRSWSTWSTSRRCWSVSGAEVVAAAYATAGVIAPRPSAESMRGMEPTSRRAAARLELAVAGERWVARVMSAEARRSDWRMSCSSGGRKSSSWATSSRAASIRSRRCASAKATRVRASSAARELSAPWIMSSRFLISCRGRAPTSNIFCGSIAREVSRWSTSPRSSASADGPPACSSASTCSGACCSGAGCGDVVAVMAPSSRAPLTEERPDGNCGQRRSTILPTPGEEPTRRRPRHTSTAYDLRA